MKFNQRFPVMVWVLQRSVFYYALAALVVMGSVEFYLWDYLRLKQLQQLHITSGGSDPYSAIRYYEHLSATGLADASIYKKLSENYLLAGDQKMAQQAYQKALKCVSPKSQEYQALLETYRQSFTKDGR